MKIRAVAVLVALCWTTCVLAGDAVPREAADPFAGRGYQILHTKAYLSADFDQETFDQLWQCWEEPARSQAAKASAEAFQKELERAGYGAITTEIRDLPAFYYAEGYHQQYLDKNPDGYCGMGGTGVACPIGLDR